MCKYIFVILIIGILSAMGCAEDSNGSSNKNSFLSVYADVDSGVFQEQMTDLPGLASCFAPDRDIPEVGAGEGADVGESCKVTADCVQPLHCIRDRCVPPGPWEGYCDGVNILCGDGKECVNFQCVDLRRRCWSNVVCPAGYECACARGELCFKPTCQPADEECVFDGDCADGELCEFGSCVAINQCRVKADLRGSYLATSQMHLGVASESKVGEIISATQWIRDLLDGTGPFPGVSGLASDLMGMFLMYNIEPYQIDFLLSLVDLAEILDTVQIEHELTLDASCAEMYRGEMTFDTIQMTYENQQFTERFENIPTIGAVAPVEFGAVLQCNSMAFDEIRVDYLASGAMRWVTDVFVQEVTDGRHMHLEDALLGLIDCAAVATYVEMAISMSSAGIPPVASAVVEPVCRIAIDKVVKKVANTLADRPTRAGWMKLQGEAEVGNGQLEKGHWFGATLTGGFTGEFSAAK